LSPERRAPARECFEPARRAGATAVARISFSGRAPRHTRKVRERGNARRALVAAALAFMAASADASEESLWAALEGAVYVCELPGGEGRDAGHVHAFEVRGRILHHWIQSWSEDGWELTAELPPLQAKSVHGDAIAFSDGAALYVAHRDALNVAGLGACPRR
jgi:hypothetical protein